jgi:hypothetical protein
MSVKMRKKLKISRIFIFIAGGFLLIFLIDLFADGTASALPLFLFYVFIVLSMLALIV